MKDCANRAKPEEGGYLLLSTIIDLIEGDNVFSGSGFP